MHAERSLLQYGIHRLCGIVAWVRAEATRVAMTGVDS